MAKRRDGRSAAEVIRQVAGEIGRSVVGCEKILATHAQSFASPAR